MLRLPVCDSCQRLSDGNDKRREARGRPAKRRVQQGCNFIHLRQRFLLRQAMLTFILSQRIKGEPEEMKIRVPKLNKAHQYTSLTLNVAMWIQVRTYGSSTAAMEPLPKPLPSDWRAKPQELETATLGPAHYLCFAMSNCDNKLRATKREQSDYVRGVPICTNIPA